MCRNPITLPDGMKVACRKCDACIAVRKWDWVARACAETAVNGWGGVITLSYDGSDKSADGAKTFRYRDVQNWLHRLRKAATAYFETDVTIRYIVAGERGSQRGRVHWHVILWASQNLWKIGQWADFSTQWAAGFLPSDGPQKQFACEPQDRTRLVWSQWPYGHAFLDDVSTQSVEYVLKYALKDAFSSKNAKGNKRETRSEVNASSFFRMSKEPAIGWHWLQVQVFRWITERRVPQDGMLYVPGLTGRWYPHGEFREQYLQGLALAYNVSMSNTAKPPKGWRAMVGRMRATEVGKAELDKIEDYRNGPERTEETGSPAESARKGTVEFRYRKKADTCTRVYPCTACLNGAGTKARDEIDRGAGYSRAAWLRYGAAETAKGRLFFRWDTHHKAQRKIHSHCQLASWLDEPPSFAKPVSAEEEWNKRPRKKDV